MRHAGASNKGDLDAPAITRVLHLTAPGAALALLGLTGATAAAGAAGVAGTAAPPVTVYVANRGSGTVTPIRVATNRPGRAINTHGANTITATPDGRTVYAGSVGGQEDGDRRSGPPPTSASAGRSTWGSR